MRYNIIFFNLYLPTSEYRSLQFLSRFLSLVVFATNQSGTCFILSNNFLLWFPTILLVAHGRVIFIGQPKSRIQEASNSICFRLTATNNPCSQNRRLNINTQKAWCFICQNLIIYLFTMKDVKLYVSPYLFPFLPFLYPKVYFLKRFFSRFSYFFLPYFFDFFLLLILISLASYTWIFMQQNELISFYHIVLEEELLNYICIALLLKGDKKKQVIFKESCSSVAMLLPQFCRF